MGKNWHFCFSPSSLQLNFPAVRSVPCTAMGRAAPWLCLRAGAQAPSQLPLSSPCKGWRLDPAEAMLCGAALRQSKDITDLFLSMSHFSRTGFLLVLHGHILLRAGLGRRKVKSQTLAKQRPLVSHLLHDGRKSLQLVLICAIICEGGNSDLCHQGPGRGGSQCPTSSLLLPVSKQTQDRNCFSLKET